MALHEVGADDELYVDWSEYDDIEIKYAAVKGQHMSHGFSCIDQLPAPREIPYCDIITHRSAS